MCTFNCQIVLKKFKKANFLYKLTFKYTHCHNKKALPRKKINKLIIVGP